MMQCFAKLVYMMKNKFIYFLNILKLLVIDRRNKTAYLQSFYDIIGQHRIVVFDTETTGLDTSNDDIIQIAAIEIINGKIGRDFERYFVTEKDISQTQKIHNISYKQLQQKATNKKGGLEQFLIFLSNDALLAHNIKFDLSILNSNLLKEGLKTVNKKNNLIFCTLSLTRQLYNFSSYKLDNILKSLNINGVNSHDAMEDTEATVQLAFTLKEEIEKLNLNVNNV